MEKKELDKMTGDLLKKSLQKPENQDFDDMLMGKILELPTPGIAQPDKELMRNGWRFLILAIILFNVLVVLLSYLTKGYNTEISNTLEAIKMYVIYGGMALFLPLMLSQLDTLLKILFENRLKPRADY